MTIIDSLLFINDNKSFIENTKLNWLGLEKGTFCYILEKVEITIFDRVQCTLLYIKNDAEIFPVHYTRKIAEKGFKMAFMMNQLAMINSCEIILEK